MNLKPNTIVKSVEESQLDLLMFGRQSLYPRQYNGDRINDDDIRKLLQYANTAPNHKHTRPWRFVVFSDASKIDLLEFKKEFYIKNTPKESFRQKKVEDYEMKKNQVSHIIGLVMHRDTQERVPEIEEIAAVSCAVQNIYLSLNTFGISGYWSTGKIAFSEEMKQYLELSTKDKCLGFFYLGKSDISIPIVSKESVEQLITWKS